MPLSAEVEQLFHQLADLPHAERSRLLGTLDIAPTTCAELESLLSNDDSDDRDLRGVVHVAVDSSLESQPTKPARCGPFLLLQFIGHGGMGDVYIAERVDGALRQKVAIKVLRMSIDTASARSLFQKERQILADLSHPNIAHLVDVGQAEDGRPYLAMEYIEGTPIDEYCSHLPLERRLELFDTLCGAVAYAHRMLVIHRDIKPGNILIDSSGTPKLLDFGIAKLLDESSDATATAERRLTPQYASPEQIKGLRVGTTSDIFSLGVLLYRLTTGEPPFRKEDYPTRAELECAVCQTEPARPRTRNKQIDPDLEAIILMAMRKEPNGRYGSADAFQQDLRAWFDHRPVRARQGNWWYVARRRLRRYWLPVAAGALIVVALSVALGITIHERNLAQRRFAAVHKLAQEMLQVGNDIETLPGATPARERIIKTSLAYLEELSRDAANDLVLETDIGAAYRAVADIQGGVGTLNLGRSGEALASLAKSEHFLRDVYRQRPNDPRVIRRLALTVRAQYLLQQGLHHSGQVSDKSAELNSLAAKYEQFAPETLLKWSTLSAIYDSLAQGSEKFGNISDGLRSVKLAIKFDKKLTADPDIWFSQGNRALSLASYATLMRSAGDLGNALRTLRESLAILERMSVSVKDDIILDLNIGCDHLDMGALLAKQDELFGSSDHRAEAISELNKSLVYFRRITAVDPSEEETRINTGEGATELGRLLQESSPAAALGSYNEAIKALSAMPAKNERRNFPLSSVLSESVFALNRLGRIPEAEKRLADAKALLAGSTAPDFENGESLRNPFEALSRAESNQLASSGHYLDAIRMDTAWLRAVESKPQILQVRLTDALIVAARYQQLASVCRKAGQIEEEQTALRKRQELLAAWIQKVHSFPAY